MLCLISREIQSVNGSAKSVILGRFLIVYCILALDFYLLTAPVRNDVMNQNFRRR